MIEISHLTGIVSFLADVTGDPVKSPRPSGGLGNPLLIMVLMFVIMYFVLIRPQRKRQKDLELKIGALKSGDKIITSGGIHGIVTRVKERTLTVKVADNVKLEVEKSSVSTTLPKDGGERKAADKDKDKKEADGADDDKEKEKT